MPKQRTGDFVCVVLACGVGSKLFPLTNAQPKCLLTVGNYPLIYFALKALEDAGFDETLVVIREAWRESTQTTINNLPVKIKAEYFILPAHFDSNTTAVLFALRPRINVEDLLVVSGDVYGNFSLQKMACVYRMRNATFCIYIQPPTPEVPQTPQCEMTKNNFIVSTYPNSLNVFEFLAISPSDNRLLNLGSFNELRDKILFQKETWMKCPNVEIYKNINDLSIFMVKTFLIDHISEKSLIDVDFDFIRYILSIQFTNKNRPREVKKQSWVVDEVYDEFKPRYDYIRKIPEDPDNKEIHCYAYISEDSEPVVRVNTFPLFFWANIMELKRVSKKISPKVLEPVNSRESNDVMVGLRSSVDKTVVCQGSIIGHNVKVNKDCKITNSIILDNVIIGEKCDITNSIIGVCVNIGESCSVDESVIGPGQSIENSKKLKRQTLPNENN